jgi:hypothetical protein
MVDRRCEVSMTARNGDRARYFKNRARKLKKRQRVRALLAGIAAPATQASDPPKKAPKQ